MAEHEDREHYIPLHRADLIDMVCGDPQVAPDQKQLRAFCTRISSIYHFEYHKMMEKLKLNYASFDPDSQTTRLRELKDTERKVVMDAFFDHLVTLMEKANYKRLTQDDLRAAVEGGASDWGLNMDVNFDIFEKLEIFIRGDSVGKRARRHWLWFWREIEKDVDVYQRTLVVMRLREHKSVPDIVDTEGIYLKLLRDIPKLDLEMVLPGATIQMPRFTRGKLLVSLFGTIAYYVYAFGAALARAAAAVAGGIASMSIGALMALFSPLGVLGGYAYKQWYGYSVTKQTYAKQLTESLYYQTLDNNNGVLTHLVDEAEEQECREAILAYWALLYYAPEEGWSPQQLDDYIELQLEKKLDLEVDFEIEDALGKMLELQLVINEGEKYKAIPLQDALKRLDYRWDNYFDDNEPAEIGDCSELRNEEIEL